jgi:predicted transposase/invertase (TIGR01784 family)
MRHAIDPKIDCVFKALLGSEENRNLLIHFLNAFLAQDLIEPLVWVEILNPYNDKEFLSDKLSIVDVKARDSHDRLYQIEIQLTSYGHLPARIIYNWADIYSQQLKSGQDYLELRPTYSIWLLAENLISDDNETVHHYKMRDEQGNTLTQHGGIWLLELKKFKANRIETEDQRWLKFFREGEQLNDEALPDWMTTREMKQAMSTLSTFSEKDQHYYQYQARQEYLREQRTIQHELEQATKALLQANEREEAANQREEAGKKREELAIVEIERLKALLAQKENL